MTFEQLTYIVETWKSGTILSASQSLNVSPPAISKAISNLEDELQVNIFTRTRSGTTVTPEGEQIIQLAQKILEDAKELRALSSIKSSHTIKIGCHPQDIMNVMPNIVKALNKDYPQIDFNISLASISTLLSQIKNQEIDFGIFPMVNNFKLSSKEIVFHSFASTHLCIMAPAHSPLCSKPFVTPSDLSTYKIVLPDDPLILSLLQKAFDPIELPHLLLKTNDPQLVKQMILTNDVLGTGPEFTNRNDPLIKNNQITLLPLKCHGEYLFMEYFYTHNSKKKITSVENIFLKHLKSTFQQLLC